ncbi:MAG: 3-hydroxybutyryl-CoA dehydrogenase [Burkholderiales bacterium]
MEIKKIGVIGAGTMGNGIAQVFAACGFEVKLLDVSDAALQRGMHAISDSLERLIKKERISAADKTATLKRIAVTTDVQQFAAVDVAVEAASENLELKLKLLSDLDRVCKKNAILASNTSSISLTKIAAATARPQQVIGMHFMNPVPLMQLVEIIRALQTSDAVYQAIETLTRKIGKTPVAVKNSPGFVSNRILMPLINEAVYTLYEGLAGAEDIDTVMKLGMNHPIGPLALADLIGLDTCLAVMEVLYDGFNDSKYRPCPLLKEMVDAGRLGRKSGRGFHDYTK